jgi:hypothetical protein
MMRGWVMPQFPAAPGCARPRSWIREVNFRIGSVRSLREARERIPHPGESARASVNAARVRPGHRCRDTRGMEELP